jgi:hypothetical protein
MHESVNRRLNRSLNLRLVGGVATCTILLSASITNSFAATHKAAPAATGNATTAAGAPKTSGKTDPTREARHALTALRLLGQAEHELDEMTINLYTDLMQQKMTLDDAPDLIPGTIINQAPDYEHNHYIVPNRKWIEYHLKSIGTLFRYVHDEIDHVVTPDAVKDASAPMFGKLQFLMEDIHKHYINLLVDRVKGKYSGPLMAAEAKAIHTDIQKFEDTRKQIYILIRDQAKKS